MSLDMCGLELICCITMWVVHRCIPDILKHCLPTGPPHDVSWWDVVRRYSHTWLKRGWEVGVQRKQMAGKILAIYIDQVAFSLPGLTAVHFCTPCL